MSNNDLNKDYAQFLSASEEFPAKEITEDILSESQRILNPSLSNVILKFAAIHVISSSLTLSLCPQFGLHLFGTGHGLMNYFMELGLVGCYLACGGFYLGTTSLLTIFYFSKPEWKMFFKHQLLQSSTIALLSMGIFIMAGAQLELETSAFWFLGALITSSVLNWSKELYLRVTLEAKA